MEIKIFGKSLFSAKQAKVDSIFGQIGSMNQESKYLPDFKQLGTGGDSFSEYISISEVANFGTPSNSKGKVKKEVKKSRAITEKPKVTPKGVYELKTLHDSFFKLNTNESYVEKQLLDFKDKLGLISSEEYDMRRGVDELSSMVLRLENRKKYTEFKDFFEEFPYTTPSLISSLLKKEDHLQIGKIAQFIADMPKEAIDTMKRYDETCIKLCGKKAVFYIIADKKDFKKTETRKDPILLAQSPFGHIWQILGVWDEEMMFLEEL